MCLWARACDLCRCRYEKTLEEVTALLERERNDHVMCKAGLSEAEKYSAEVEQAFKELHTRYTVQKVTPYSVTAAFTVTAMALQKQYTSTGCRQHARM